MCMGVRSGVQGRAGACTDMWCYVWVGAGVCRPQVCAGVHGCAQMCIGIHGYAIIMNFHNTSWRLMFK